MLHYTPMQNAGQYRNPDKSGQTSVRSGFPYPSFPVSKIENDAPSLPLEAEPPSQNFGSHEFEIMGGMVHGGGWYGPWYSMRVRSTWRSGGGAGLGGLAKRVARLFKIGFTYSDSSCTYSELVFYTHARNSAPQHRQSPRFPLRRDPSAESFGSAATCFAHDSASAFALALVDSPRSLSSSASASADADSA